MSPGKQEWVRANMGVMTNGEMAAVLGVSRSMVNDVIHKRGWRRHEASHKACAWEPWQVELLLKEWRNHGDTALAKMLGFVGAKPHKRVWKKRQLLGLHRTKEEVEAIRRANAAAGQYANPRYGDNHHNWVPEGTMRVWAKRGDTVQIVVKVPAGHGSLNNRDWEFLQRHVWRKLHGEVPGGIWCASQARTGWTRGSTRRRTWCW